MSTLRFWRRKTKNLEIGILASVANCVKAEKLDGIDVKRCWNDVGMAGSNTNGDEGWFDVVENVRSEDVVVEDVVVGDENDKDFVNTIEWWI